MLNGHRQEAIAMLAGIGIGAALMYFVDPQRGNARRAGAADQAGGKIRSARWDLEVARRDLRNRARGVAARMRNRLSDDAANDEQLVERVRAELGHHVDSLRGVEVSASNGRVTLRGAVPAEQRDELIDTARHVRGVDEVEDELSV